jgi:septal ring factor EnvC (AmiA/AmiB activator)
MEIFLVRLAIALGFLWCTKNIIPPAILWVLELQHQMNERVQKRKYQQARERAEREAERLRQQERDRFLSLTPEEQDKITRDRERDIEETLRAKLEAVEKEKRAGEVNARLMRAESERRKVEANQPDNVRRHALRGFTGGRS